MRQVLILFHSPKGNRSVSQIPIESLADDGNCEKDKGGLLLIYLESGD